MPDVLSKLSDITGVLEYRGRILLDMVVGGTQLVRHLEKLARLGSIQVELAESDKNKKKQIKVVLTQKVVKLHLQE